MASFLALPSPPNALRPTSPSGSCPMAQLPHELMAEVFLYVDPHTLYTSIRSLNRAWKLTVETHIIPMCFKSGCWRIALRVHRRPRKLGPGSQSEAMRALQRAHQGSNETDEQRRARVESTLGAWEDELETPTDPLDQTLQPKTITAFLPLQLKAVNAVDNRFEFSTGENWYAMHELDNRAMDGDSSFRLDLDFGVAWRFDGDGKEMEEQRPGGWTNLDQENGWLSKFWCSAQDVDPAKSGTNARTLGASSAEGSVKLHATPLARRRRMPGDVEASRRVPTLHPAFSSSSSKRPLQWDDHHLEYFHLDLSLGTEFFVRRSARANLLMRALEAEAARRETIATAEDNEEDLSSSLTESLHGSPPSLKPTPLKPIAKRLGKLGATGGSLASGSQNGSATPPPSRSSPPSQLRPDMSPAEQLRMITKSKAAAKAARSMRGPSGSSGGASSPLVGGSRKPSQPSSMASSRVTSRAPSRMSSRAPSQAPSRAPTRPGSPTPGETDQEFPSLDGSGGGTGTRSLILTPLDGPTPHIPGTPLGTPRDTPWHRAVALSHGTASDHTQRALALSGYTTPRHTQSLSFAARGGGGAQPGGTPFADFKARLRRRVGFEEASQYDAIRQQLEHLNLDGGGEEGSRARSLPTSYLESLSKDSGAWHNLTLHNGQETSWRYARIIDPILGRDEEEAEGEGGVREHRQQERVHEEEFDPWRPGTVEWEWKWSR